MLLFVILAENRWGGIGRRKKQTEALSECVCLRFLSLAHTDANTHSLTP